MKRFTFKVLGKPVGKQRIKITTRGKFPHAYTPAKTVDYESRIKQCAIDAGVEIMERVKVDLMIVIPCGWKTYKLKPNQPLEPLARPDGDNVLKSILDACQGVAFVNDKHVMESYVRWGFSRQNNSYVKVTITEVNWINYLVD